MQNQTFLYSGPVGVDPTPVGTPYNKTSFAHVHKNALFITVDVFQVLSEDYFDRQNMGGGEGAITANVTGSHLEWFEDVLIAANNDNTIKHIFVQAHIPVIEPVRKMSSSSMPFDKSTDSEFWTLMQKYNVDVYFAGEVHALTATRDPNSNLIQIVSRGNRFSNFIKVNVTDDKGFKIEAFNEVGELWRWNANYTKYGELTVDKSSNGTVIESNGALTLLDISAEPLIHFGFEMADVYSLKDRQILGLKYDNYKDTLIGNSTTVRGITSVDGMENHGVFGRELVSLLFFSLRYCKFVVFMLR